MKQNVVLLGLLGLALLGCDSPDRTGRLQIGGRTVMIDSTAARSLRGERMIDQYGVVASPTFVSWSGEIEEIMTEGGRREAHRLCGGPAELVSLTRAPFPARTATLRFRCADPA